MFDRRYQEQTVSKCRELGSGLEESNFDFGCILTLIHKSWREPTLGAMVVWFGSNTRKVKDSVVDHGVDDDYDGLPQRTGLGCIDRRCQGPGPPQWH